MNFKILSTAISLGIEYFRRWSKYHFFFFSDLITYFQAPLPGKMTSLYLLTSQVLAHADGTVLYSRKFLALTCHFAFSFGILLAQKALPGHGRQILYSEIKFIQPPKISFPALPEKYHLLSWESYQHV